MWSTPPEMLHGYDPLLVLCAEGLRETLHPQSFIARQAFADLLAAAGARAKVEPLLHRIIPPIRMALMSSDVTVVTAGLAAVRQLVACVDGSVLVHHMTPLLVPINKHCGSKQAQLRDDAQQTLLALDYCDEDAGVVLRAKLPSYGR